MAFNPSRPEQGDEVLHPDGTMEVIKEWIRTREDGIHTVAMQRPYRNEYLQLRPYWDETARAWRVLTPDRQRLLNGAWRRRRKLLDLIAVMLIGAVIGYMLAWMIGA